MIGTAQDVTTAKTNEADLRAAKEQAESANRAKDEFLAMLGHELRNPLAPMLTALELLRVRMGEAGARERDVIHRQVRNLAQLVDDMLDVAQIRKGRMTIAKEALYARQVIAKALEFVTPMLEERRHRLQVDIEPPSLVIVGDERRLIQAVTNLLTNAVKYTEAGGSIRVAASSDGVEVEIRVSDTGKGFSPAFLPRAFDLFVQGDRTPDRSEGGLGLGLPIVRSIVERHGGSVSAASMGIGKGSEFVISLPAAGADTPLPAIRPLFAGDGFAASSPKVLIIDDNRDAADTLHALLRDYGFTCASALDGPSGLETVSSFAPDAILLDLGLPGLDGYEVARRIRSQPDGARVLIVAVTGYGEERDRERSARGRLRCPPGQACRSRSAPRRPSRYEAAPSRWMGWSRPRTPAPRAGGPRPTDRADLDTPEVLQFLHLTGPLRWRTLEGVISRHFARWQKVAALAPALLLLVYLPGADDAPLPDGRPPAAGMLLRAAGRSEQPAGPTIEAQDCCDRVIANSERPTADVARPATPRPRADLASSPSSSMPRRCSRPRPIASTARSSDTVPRAKARPSSCSSTRS